MSVNKRRSQGLLTKTSRIGRIMAFFLFVGLLATVGAYGVNASFAEGKIAQGVAIMDVAVGGRNKDEAKELLREKVSELIITFEAEAGRTTLVPGTETQEQNPIALYDVEAAIDRAMAVGRSGHPLVRATTRVKSLVAGTSIPLPYLLDRKALVEELHSAFAAKMRPARDARLLVRLDRNNGEYVASVLPDEQGKTFNVDAAVAQTEDRLRNFSLDPVIVPVTTDKPTLTADEIRPITKLVPAALALAPFELVGREVRWTVTKSMVADWLSVTTSMNGPVLTIDHDKVTTYLKTIAPDLETEPRNAVFEMKDEKVVVFEPSIDGITIDIEQSYLTIESMILGFTEATPKLELLLAVVPPDITTEESNPYGIGGLLGTGESNFKGSPANRRVNIRIGAKSLDGILVMPGEEFSLLKALGDIDGKHGYLQELVIKDNKTIPEYGGGLCQIGSTTFRAVLNSGLPVTARRNHSYRVPYYERDGAGNYMGPGKDATIYNPSPDFKFLNDTTATIMIRTQIIGDMLRFSFWGKPDGRTQEQSPVKVWNKIPPPEKKMIETTELPPGKIKCTEKPHEGADAQFTYTVTYPNGEVKVKDFFSRYRPWGEVCLIGVDPAAASFDAADTTAGLPSLDAQGATGR